MPPHCGLQKFPLTVPSADGTCVGIFHLDGEIKRRGLPAPSKQSVSGYPWLRQRLLRAGDRKSRESRRGLGRGRRARRALEEGARGAGWGALEQAPRDWRTEAGPGTRDSRLSCRLRILSLHALFLIQCSLEGSTMVARRAGPRAFSRQGAPGRSASPEVRSRCIQTQKRRKNHLFSFFTSEVSVDFFSLQLASRSLPADPRQLQAEPPRPGLSRPPVPCFMHEDAGR